MPNPETNSSPAAETASPVLIGGVNRRLLGRPTPRRTDSSDYLHAFRRVGLTGVVLGVLLAVTAAAAVWLVDKPSFSATAVIHIAPSQPELAFPTAGRSSGETYEAYRGTQQELLTSRFVLSAAVSDPAVADLPMIRGQSDKPAFLRERIAISLPRSTEVMLVSLKGRDRESAIGLVRAVVNAYMEEVVNRDQRRRGKSLSQLETILAEKEIELGRRQAELRKLTGEAGSHDLQALSVKQQVLLQHYGEVRRELLRAQSDIRRIQGEIQAHQAALGGDPAEAVVPQAEMIAALNSDPLYRDLQRGASQMNLETAVLNAAARPAMTARYRRGMVDVEKAIEQQIDVRYQAVRQQVWQNGRAMTGLQIKKLQSQLELLLSQQQALQADVDDLRKQADRLGNWSVEVEVTRSDLKQLRDVLDHLAREKEQLKVELRAASRISLIQEADAPIEANQTARIALAVLAGLLALAAPLGLLVWRDVSTRRINTSEDIGRELGLEVFGVVLRVPARAAKHLSALNGRGTRWRAMLGESADALAARLLHVAQGAPTQVVMVTSAVSGEGKSVLSAELATALARTGRRTLLVDFDLRHPSVDKRFPAALEPGVGDVLRGERSLCAAVHGTPVANLSIMTAGAWRPDLLAALANGAGEAFFDAARKEYQFVVVDGCPVLPVADASYVCRLADAVILAVMQDVSRAPRVQAACETLAAMGSRVLGTVVAESSASNGRVDARYYAQGRGQA